MADGEWPACDCPKCVDYTALPPDQAAHGSLSDWDGKVDCEWRGCTSHGYPEDEGWCFWWRKYLWLEEGFFCPKHNKMIEEGHKLGTFDDWPLDTSPEVLAREEMMAGFHDIETPEGAAILADALGSLDEEDC
jgi:hypothetical protein